MIKIIIITYYLLLYLLYLLLLLIIILIILIIITYYYYLLLLFLLLRSLPVMCHRCECRRCNINDLHVHRQWLYHESSIFQDKTSTASCAARPESIFRDCWNKISNKLNTRPSSQTVNGADLPSIVNSSDSTYQLKQKAGSFSTLRDR